MLPRSWYFFFQPMEGTAGFTTHNVRKPKIWRVGKPHQNIVQCPHETSWLGTTWSRFALLLTFGVQCQVCVLVASVLIAMTRVWLVDGWSEEENMNNSWPSFVLLFSWRSCLTCYSCIFSDVLWEITCGDLGYMIVFPDMTQESDEVLR